MEERNRKEKMKMKGGEEQEEEEQIKDGMTAPRPETGVRISHPSHSKTYILLHAHPTCRY